MAAKPHGPTAETYKRGTELLEVHDRGDDKVLVLYHGNELMRRRWRTREQVGAIVKGYGWKRV